MKYRIRQTEDGRYYPQRQIKKCIIGCVWENLYHVDRYDKYLKENLEFYFWGDYFSYDVESPNESNLCAVNTEEEAINHLTIAQLRRGKKQYHKLRAKRWSRPLGH